MTLDEFCEKNPQLKRPQFLRQELIDKANSFDLEKVTEKIHASEFLLSRRWLPWILERLEDILNGVYRDYPNSFVPQEKKQKPRQCEIEYGEALKRQREIAGFSQLELSKQLNISQEVIDITEKGEKLSVISYCVLLADFYGISLDELVGRKFPKE